MVAAETVSVVVSVAVVVVVVVVVVAVVAVVVKQRAVAAVCQRPARVELEHLHQHLIMGVHGFSRNWQFLYTVLQHPAALSHSQRARRQLLNQLSSSCRALWYLHPPNSSAADHTQVKR